MKTQNNDSLSEWSELYEAAIEFKKLKCWRWMSDDDMFGVQNPETDEIGYCCVMGRLKEVFALSVYLGSEGLGSCLKVRDHAAKMSDSSMSNMFGVFNAQKCLMASFENRSELHKKDLSVIRELGLKFRGKHEWPMFRNCEPDFAPWFANSSEVRFLAAALRQATEVALKFKNDPGLLNNPAGDTKQYLIRSFQKGKWLDVWMTPAKYEPHRPTSIINETLLARLKKSKFTRGKTWLADCVILPTMIGEGERPYYPYGFPILSEDGMALGMDLLQPGEVDKELPNKFMELIQKIEIFPMSLVVGSQRTFDLLEPVAKALKITIEQSDRLPELEFFLNGMEQFFGSS